MQEASFGRRLFGYWRKSSVENTSRSLWRWRFEFAYTKTTFYREPPQGTGIFQAFLVSLTRSFGKGLVLLPRWFQVPIWNTNSEESGDSIVMEILHARWLHSNWWVCNVISAENSHNPWVAGMSAEKRLNRRGGEWQMTEELDDCKVSCAHR